MSDNIQTNDEVILKNTKLQKRGSFTSWRGNKYPQVKLRGFYSDVVSNQNAEKTGVILTFLSHCFYFKKLFKTKLGNN